MKIGQFLRERERKDRWLIVSNMFFHLCCFYFSSFVQFTGQFRNHFKRSFIVLFLSSKNRRCFFDHLQRKISSLLSLLFFSRMGSLQMTIAHNQIDIVLCQLIPKQEHFSIVDIQHSSTIDISSCFSLFPFFWIYRQRRCCGGRCASRWITGTYMAECSIEKVGQLSEVGTWVQRMNWPNRGKCSTTFTTNRFE